MNANEKPKHEIAPLLHSIRGLRVILDTDLAKLYGVQTFRLNEAIKRNRERFPDDFMFQLTSAERDFLISQLAMSKAGRGGRRTLPHPLRIALEKLSTLQTIRIIEGTS